MEENRVFLSQPLDFYLTCHECEASGKGTNKKQAIPTLGIPRENFLSKYNIDDGLTEDDVQNIDLMFMYVRYGIPTP